MTDRPEKTLSFFPGEGKTGSAGYRGIDPSQFRNMWLTTFTDLTALLLAFFVLQFSMSRLDQVQWQNLSDSFQQRLEKITDSEAPVPQDSLTADRPDHIPGDDLTYLFSVIGQHLNDRGLEDRLNLKQHAGSITMSFQAEWPTEGATTQDSELFTEIGTLIERLDNRVGLSVQVLGVSEDRAGVTALNIARAYKSYLAERGVRNLSTIRAYSSTKAHRDEFEHSSSEGGSGQLTWFEFSIYAHLGER